MTTAPRVLYDNGWQVVLIVNNGRVPAAEYIESLALPDRTRVEAFLERVSYNGPPSNVEKNRKIDRELWELK